MTTTKEVFNYIADAFEQKAKTGMPITIDNGDNLVSSGLCYAVEVLYNADMIDNELYTECSNIIDSYFDKHHITTTWLFPDVEQPRRSELRAALARELAKGNLDHPYETTNHNLEHN